MNETLSPGDIIDLVGAIVGNYKAELLPKLSVDFGFDAVGIGPPIENISNQVEAIRIVKERFPEAFFENWLTCYAGRPNLDEGPNGEWEISILFYPTEVDVIHEELLPDSSPVSHVGGRMCWAVKLIQQAE